MKLSLMLLSLLAVSALAQTITPDAVNGKRLHMRNGCYQCHGTVGQGGMAGPRLAQTRLSQAAFISYVRNPRPGNMPPYRSKVMTDQELADVYAYLGSVPPPVPLASIPILNQP
jgi:ubiquinol-cytochrome c reductase cytochrome c subunit